MGDVIRLVLAGDVMTGRGVDQVLANPGSAELHEPFVRDARSYVALAERVNGPVPRPVDARWPWGAALVEMDRFAGAVRIFNLETSVTRSDEVALGKTVTYRMSPANLDVLRVSRADVWTLANNHVLDYGVSGLLETLATLHDAGQRTAGAGRDAEHAWRPVAVHPAAGPRVLVLSVADVSSGVPPGWAATGERPGVALLPDLRAATAEAVMARFAGDSRPDDLRVVSVHWGSNWGYAVDRAQGRFAHRLVDAGAHLVHGHSSHHPRPMEVYRGHLVLHGCGDLVNDYEGIGGHEQFRSDLRLLHLAELDRGSGTLASLTMVPLRARRLSLERAGPADASWLADMLARHSRGRGAAVAAEDGLLRLLLS